jgi:hypothetical protein
MTDERIESADLPGSVNRRSFLTQGAGLGLGLGLPPLLAGCGGGDGAPWMTPASSLGSPTGKHSATLFFNLSHEAHAGKTYYLTGGGQRIALTPVADQPHVLRRVRQSNAFLRGVPDDQITHHVDSATFANGVTTVCYVSSDFGDPDSGTWSMSSVQLYIPPAGASRAYAAARQLRPSGPLPMSAKRRRYGAPASRTEQDLRDERVLLDPVSQASTMVGFQPDLMSLDAGAAHTIHSNHVDLDINVYNLGLMLASPQYGPALPQQPGSRPSGWATLVPVLGDDGVPLRNKHGQHAGRIQYLPSLNPDLGPLAKAGAFGATAGVRDDVSLGMDATSLAPSEPLDLGLTGTMWMRHDGQTSVDQSPGQLAPIAGAVKMVLQQQNGQVAFKVRASATASGSGTKVTLSFMNWFLEFRGVWLQFLRDGKVLTLKDVAEYEQGSIISGHDKQGDTADAMFVSLVGPTFTVLAIPVIPGTFQVVFDVPQKADTVRVLSSTLSLQSGNVYPDTTVPGAVMTGIVNYGLTMMLAAVGAGPVVPAMYKIVVVPVARALSLELVKMLSDAINNGAPLSKQIDTADFWGTQALILAKALITQVATENIKALVEWVVGAITEAFAEDAIPVVGQIMQAISVAIGVANVLETDVALAVAPWTYVDDLVFTHDLNVEILRADGDPTFPEGATRYTVTAMFDSGTPYLQSFDLSQQPPPTVPVVAFKGVPLGGNVNVSVAFVRESSLPGMPDLLLGKGSTGLVANDANTAPTIRIEQIRYPINANTQYQHQQKTTLDANGHHLWAAAAAPKANLVNTACGGGGTACGFRSITVRQGTGPSAPSYLGYAWESQNLDPQIAPSCIGNVVGQLDQMANLNADGTSAQAGYANGSCGIGGHGVRVAYSLLAQGTQNFYLDTTNPDAPMVRQVMLDQKQPAFVSPNAGKAWGALNFASDGLLLHPAGFLVSINRTRHQIETLRIPPAALTDADAQRLALAQVQSGKGTRPGLMNEPVAAAVSSDGVILVLESGNNRIQAFDLGGNPVRHFPAQTGPGISPYSLTLGATDPVQGWQYLDLAVEYTGYLYVLSYNANSFSYRLDIYHPNQSGNQPISHTPNVNAARLTIDYWRNVYTLNYELLTMPNGTPAGLTEPSVSMWIP